MVRGEVLPPAPRISVHLPRAPTGVVEAVFSGFFSRLAARSVADDNWYRQEQQRGIQIATATARELVRLEKALAELDDIDAILLEDQRDRDHGRAMAQQRRQAELRRADLEQQRLDMQQAQLDHDRRLLAIEQQKAIQNADYGLQRDLRLQAEQRDKDRLAGVIAETEILHHELLRDLLLRRAKGNASAEAIAAEAEEIKAIQRFGELLGQHKPTETQRDELAELMMEQVKEARNYAASNAETVQVLDRLALNFSNLLKRK
ncbi:MAG: hypothetical protein ABL907_23675 [Hyphomicrobium sp.]